ncbi:MAG: hypothetical protein Q7S64_01415 [bacterium]|nr:hypothetical protein [bacterium]
MAFVIPPVKPAPLPEKKEAATGGFAVPPMGYIDPAAVVDESTFSRGDKVSTLKRTQAYDPYSNENFYLAAHTPAKVIPARDERHSLKDQVTVIITSFDNGSGRIASIPAEDLVKTDLE